jgi:phage terminase small subunit
MPAPRKPKSEHQLDGTWERAVANAPSAAKATATGLPPMPADLDPIAKGCWELICKTRANWMAISDGLALRHLCELWALRAATFKVLKKNPTDKLARTAFNQYGVEFSKMAARFGLTPQDRARLGEIDLDEFDPAAEFVC